MKFVELKKSLTETISPCYLIFGEDSFLCKTSVELIEKAIFGSIDKNNINKQIFSTEDNDNKKIIDTLNTMPFFTNKKLVIYKEYENKKNNELLSLLKDYLSNPNESSVLVILTNKDSEFVKILQNKVTTIDCNRLDKNMLTKWIQNRLSTSAVKAEIDADACELLIEYTNGYLSKITLELDKLCSLCSGKITVEHIKNIVPKDLEYSIFELTDSLASGNIKKAEQIKQDLLADKKNYAVILNLVSSFFRRLFYSLTSEGTEKEIAEMLSVKEYAIVKSKQLAQKFGAKKLKDIMELCADLDYKTKTSQISIEHAVDYCLMFILNM